MAAIVEIDMFLTGNCGVNQLFSFLEQAGLSVSIETFSLFDDWHYTNLTDIDLAHVGMYVNDASLKKFSRADLMLDHQWKCVLITSHSEGTYRNFSFGFNTKHFAQSAESNLDDCISFLYEKATDMINDALGQEQFQERFLAASMGVEYSVKFDRDLMAMLNDDNGVARWILPKKLGLPVLLEKFVKEEKSESIVLTRCYPTFSVDCCC